MKISYLLKKGALNDIISGNSFCVQQSVIKNTIDINALKHRYRAKFTINFQNNASYSRVTLRK